MTADLHSVHHAEHPPVTEDDLAGWEYDMRCAFTELYEETLRPLPEHRDHRATVLARRAAIGREYARYADQASFVSRRLGEREIAEGGGAA
jgi:hypothetical protein